MDDTYIIVILIMFNTFFEIGLKLDSKIQYSGKFCFESPQTQSTELSPEQKQALFSSSMPRLCQIIKLSSISDYQEPNLHIFMCMNFAIMTYRNPQDVNQKCSL